jgi:hypothetical protein
MLPLTHPLLAVDHCSPPSQLLQSTAAVYCRSLPSHSTITTVYRCSLPSQQSYRRTLPSQSTIAIYHAVYVAAVYRRSPRLSLPLQQSRVPSPVVAARHRNLTIAVHVSVYRCNNLEYRRLPSQSTVPSQQSHSFVPVHHRNLMSQYTISV